MVGFVDSLRDEIRLQIILEPGKREKISHSKGKRYLNAYSAEYKFLDIPQWFI